MGEGTVSDYDRARELGQELKKYTNEENDELQEACDGLIYLARCSDYVSNEFYEALIKELESQLKNYQDNTEWVEREITPKPYKVRELEWKF